MASLEETIFPDRIETESQLDELMTRPRQVLVDLFARLNGPLVVLGASGKMGPTLSVLAQRAAELAGTRVEVIGVSRFTDPPARRWLEDRGVRTIVCDLLEPAQVERLPDAENVVYMAGRKFGTADNPAMTWAMNALPPAYVARRYSASRMVALSTGTVYPLVAVESGGSREQDDVTPIGEYANACLARERLFEYFSQQYGTRIALIRLNYAVELRYGVLVDIARKVYLDQPVDVTMGYLNCMWQGDANELCLRSLDLTACPPAIVNLTGREILSVRALALRFGELLGKKVRIVGTESGLAYLNDASSTFAALGEPATPMEDVLRQTALWVSHDGRTLGKPTHFEVSDGRY